jgi:hypothetical protein
MLTGRSRPRDAPSLQWCPGTEPHTPPSGFDDMIMAAARAKSCGSPTRTAMMKSAGEQSAGQAPLHGLVSQYWQASISARSWASVRKNVVLMTPPGREASTKERGRGRGQRGEGSKR